MVILSSLYTSPTVVAQRDQISTETLSKAILEKRSDGTLRLMTLNSSGCSEYRIFNDEECLDCCLRGYENTSVWKIKDDREEISRIIYKYDDGEEEKTYSNKRDLYRELASFCDHGLFAIRSGCKVKYIQEKRRWFHRTFEKLSKEQAVSIITENEKSKSTWRKVYTIGLMALAGVSSVYFAKEAFPNVYNNPSVLSVQKSFSPSTYIPNLGYPAQLLGGAVTAYVLSAMHSKSHMGGGYSFRVC